MITAQRLDHLVLTVKDIQKSVHFYTTYLGMKKTVFKGSRVALCFGESKINLHEKGKEFKPKAKNVQTGSTDLCFIIDTPIQEAKELLLKQGICIEEGVIERTGARGVINSIYLRDPDENLLELSNYKGK